MRPMYDLPSVFAAQIRIAEEESGRCYEPMIALVTDNKDPQKLGRVKVKYPVLSEQDTSWWAPIVMLGAGKNRGWFFIPEKDDEVLVLFEHGDMNRPIVIGGIWNGKDKPADKNPGGNPRRVIRSRKNSKITFDDEKEQLIIEDGAQKGKITFDAKANKITIEALDGDVCFQSPADDMTIVAKSIEMKATDNLEIHAGDKMSWGAGGSATIKGSDATLSGSKVNFNTGNAQMPPAPTTNPQDVPDPYEAGSSGQGGSLAQSQQQSQSSAASAGGSSAAASSASSSQSRSPASTASESQSEPQQDQPEQKQDDQHVYVVHSTLKTPGGQPLGLQHVVLVKKGTKEAVGGPTQTDKDGNVSFTMPEDGEFDILVLEEDHTHNVTPPPDHEVATHLRAQFFENDLPLVGETAQVSGNGVNVAAKLGGGGELDLALEPGEYEIKVKNQAFHASALRRKEASTFQEFDLEPVHDGGNDDFAAARANRYSPSNLGA